MNGVTHIRYICMNRWLNVLVWKTYDTKVIWESKWSYFILEIRSCKKQKQQNGNSPLHSPLTFAPVIRQESRWHCSFLQLASPTDRNILLFRCEVLTADISAPTKDWKSWPLISPYCPHPTGTKPSISWEVVKTKMREIFLIVGTAWDAAVAVCHSMLSRDGYKETGRGEKRWITSTSDF